MPSIIEKALDRIADDPAPAREPTFSSARRAAIDGDGDFARPLPEGSVARLVEPAADEAVAPASDVEALAVDDVPAVAAEAPAALPLGMPSSAAAPPPVAAPAAPAEPVSLAPTLGETVDALDDRPRIGRYHEIDFEELARRGCVTPENLHSTVAEQIRLVKRPLLQPRPSDVDDAGWHHNLIATTSSLPGEGKTFTTLNLAISLAMELDRTVLLVDGDVAKSDISRVLDYEAEAGLSDLLTEPSLDVSDVIVKTNLPALSFIPAGMRKPNLTELFASEQMAMLCDELATRYSDRLVLFDCAPLLAATGAPVLCELMGQVVFVVESTSTSRAAIRESLRMLGNARSVGVVLNKSRQHHAPGGKYGGYYYYYGGGGGGKK